MTTKICKNCGQIEDKHPYVKKFGSGRVFRCKKFVEETGCGKDCECDCHILVGGSGEPCPDCKCLKFEEEIKFTDRPLPEGWKKPKNHSPTVRDALSTKPEKLEDTPEDFGSEKDSNGLSSSGTFNLSEKIKEGDVPNPIEPHQSPCESHYWTSFVETEHIKTFIKKLKERIESELGDNISINLIWREIDKLAGEELI